MTVEVGDWVRYRAWIIGDLLKVVVCIGNGVIGVAFPGDRLPTKWLEIKDILEIRKPIKAQP